MPGCEGKISQYHNHDIHQNEHDHANRSFSKLLSKEVSQPNSSCRVYYGETAVAIPFVWESQPGTPKHTLFESSSLPPLTPPPSYSAGPAKPKLRSASSGNNKPKFDLLVSSIFPRNKSAARARRLSQPSSVFSLSSLSSTSSSSSSSWSNSSLTASKSTRVNSNNNNNNNAVSFDDYEADLQYDVVDDIRDESAGDSPAGSGSSTPTSTLWFPAAMKKTAWRFVAGCYSAVNVKNDRIH